MKIERKTFHFEVKAVEDTGAFSGYLAVFGNVDSYGDRIKRGAFRDTLKDLKATGRKVPVLWQHWWDKPIGAYTELREDDHGLYVEGLLLRDDVQQAREAHALLKAGAISGQSIGFETMESKDSKDGTRELTAIKLWEGSIVTFPANEAARVEAVKHALDHGRLPTLPEFERFLREAGFSKSQAAAVAGGGLAKLLRSESASDPQAASVRSALDIVRAIRLA